MERKLSAVSVRCSVIQYLVSRILNPSIKPSKSLKKGITLGKFYFTRKYFALHGFNCASRQIKLSLQQNFSHYWTFFGFSKDEFGFAELIFGFASHQTGFAEFYSALLYIKRALRSFIWLCIVCNLHSQTTILHFLTDVFVSQYHNPFTNPKSKLAKQKF